MIAFKLHDLINLPIDVGYCGRVKNLSLIHISEPTRQAEISYAVLKSTNDSINKMIERGLENIIFDPKLQLKMEMFAPKSK